MKKVFLLLLFFMYTSPARAAQVELIKNNDSDSLIVFLAGWCMDSSQIRPWIKNENVLFVSDYATPDFSFDFTPYRHIRLIAFSAGVMMAAQYRDKLPDFEESVAVSGLPVLFDGADGIADISDDLKRVGETGVSPFRLKYLVASQDELNKFNESFRLRAGSTCDAELDALKTYKKLPAFDFDTVYIAEKDAMIPTENQKKAWKNHSYRLIRGENHFAFYAFESLSDVFVKTNKSPRRK